MRFNEIAQPHIPFAGFGLPSALPLSPLLPTPLLPAPLDIQAQPSFNLHLMLARANYASLAQQQSLQHARYLLGPFNVLAPGLSFSPFPFHSHELLGHLQLPISALQLTANAFTPNR
jgi:hypothetical protein